MKAVVDIIQKLKNELVSDRELYIVKESVKTDLIISDESTYNRISNYGKSYIHGETIETVEEAAEKIGQVTAEEVRAFVQKHFALSQMSLSLWGFENIALEKNGKNLDDIQNGESKRTTLVKRSEKLKKIFCTGHCRICKREAVIVN